jgi:hypothetical protein
MGGSMKQAIIVDIKQVHLGVFHSLMLEFELHRLPRLLRLKDKVDSGKAINDVDFEFLCKEIKDACMTKHLTVNYPELEEFCLRLGHLYKELCDEAVENER